MKNTVIGHLDCQGTLLSVKEVVPNPKLKDVDPEIELSLGEAVASLELNAVRKLRRILKQAEEHLVQQHEAQNRKRNLSFSFEA